jgi:hypothetical protein
MSYVNHRFLLRHAVALALCVVALEGCDKKEQPLAPLPAQSLAPDFSLTDVNPNSPTSGHAVSPRSELGRISAWYFGHAT